MTFNSAPIFDQIKSSLAAMSADEKKDTLKKVNGIFEMAVKNSAGAEQVWTLELKNKGEVVTGKTDAKPDIVISLGDDVFCDLASGKLNGQKAFMSGKLKVKGNMMLATKLDTVLKASKPKAKM